MFISIGYIQMPHYRSGCGGIDLFLGSFSFINAQQFTQLLRNIGSNCQAPEISHDPERMKRRVSSICDRLDFDPERVIAWAFSQAVLAGIWSVEDRESPEWAIEVALAFKENFKFKLEFLKPHRILAKN